MRKHFLILMLLALLPLAGWATITVTTDPALNAAVDYDGSNKQVIKTALEATASGNLTIYYAVNTTGIEPDVDAENTWYEGIDNANLKVNAANTYYAFYKIVSDNGGEAPIVDAIEGTFKINKVPATIATAPSAKNLTYSAAAQQLVKAGSSVTGTIEYALSTDGGLSFGAFAAAIPTSTDASEDLVVKYKVVADANHTDLVADDMLVPVTIKKKNLRAKAHGFTAAESIFGVFEQNTVVTIDYDGFVGGETVAVLDEAPSAAIVNAVKADGNCVSIAGTKYIKAGDYEEALEVTGGSDDNYEIICLNNDLNIAEAKVKVDLKAAPADAIFGSPAAAKTEWPIAWADANTYLTIQRQTGLDTYTDVAEADFAAVVLRKGSGTVKDPYAFNSEVKMTRANTSTNKGEYLLALSGVEATANTVIEKQTNSTNLKFNITAAILTIKAGNKWKVYGSADPKEQDGSWAFTVKAGGVAYDGLSSDQIAAIKAGLTRAEGETAGDYKIDFSDELKDEENPLFKDNYTITWTAGWLTIEKQNLTITAKDQTLYVGNTVEKLGQDEDVNYTVEGLKFEDGATVTLAFAPYIAAFEGLKYTAEEAKTYNATLPGHVAAGEDSDVSYGADGAAAYNAELDDAVEEGEAVPADFEEKVGYAAGGGYLTTAEARAYNATLPGAKDADDKIPYTEETAAAYNALLEGAVSTADWKIEPYDQSGVIVDGDGVLTTAGEYANAIAINLANEAALAENYNITLNLGTLTVVDATTNLVLSLTNDNAEAIESADEHDVNVSFGAGTLKGQTWYAMVLPFAVKTTELVSQLKNSENESVFAIVNVFDDKNSVKGDIKFVMEWSEVPANTPFMIKTAEDVDMSKVTFAAKTIAFDANPATKADADGDQFLGTYSKKSIIHDSENHIYYGWYDSADQKRWRQPKSTAHEMQPLQAYLKYAPGSFDGEAPVITLEDIIDGNVTAIKTFTMDGGDNALVKDGWYTLNGVKLQGVPTEKGIYINNGKKVVIK